MTAAKDTLPTVISPKKKFKPLFFTLRFYIRLSINLLGDRIRVSWKCLQKICCRVKGKKYFWPSKNLFMYILCVNFSFSRRKVINVNNYLIIKTTNSYGIFAKKIKKCQSNSNVEVFKWFFFAYLFKNSNF